MRGIVAGVILALGCGAAMGQTAKPMIPAAEPLWVGGAPGALGTEPGDVPTLTAFIPASNPTKSAVIIAPGGGYQHLSMDKEGYAIARWLNERGVAGFVLTYRLGRSITTRWSWEMGSERSGWCGRTRRSTVSRRITLGCGGFRRAGTWRLARGRTSIAGMRVQRTRLSRWAAGRIFWCWRIR